MPPRWLSVGIVAAWLATTAWLFWHDLWPDWRPGQPPRFSIDLVEEVRSTTKAGIRWNVRRRREKNAEAAKTDTAATWIDLGAATTWTEYRQSDDTFVLRAELKSLKKDPPELLSFSVQCLASEYHVDRKGRLKSLEAVLGLSSKGAKEASRNNQTPRNKWPAYATLLLQNQPFTAAACSIYILTDPKQTSKVDFSLKPTECKLSPLQLTIWGEARDDQFFAHCKAQFSLREKDKDNGRPEHSLLADGATLDLPPVKLPSDISVLLPLHPVDRIYGLYLGQSWRQPLLDPLHDALGDGVHFIDARVLPQTRQLQEGDEDAMTCLVIEYEDKGHIIGHTWVEQISDRVQLQEVLLAGDTWTLRRDNPRSAAKRRLPLQTGGKKKK